MKMDENYLAKKMYDVYCEAVGGKNYNGDDLPNSEEFFNDETKQLQVSAWKAVAVLAWAELNQ